MDTGDEGARVDPRNAEGASADRMDPGASLEDAEWRLTDVRDAGGALVRVDPDVIATARFADGRVTGSTGCNRYMGSCTLDGDAIQVSGIASTLRACPPPSSTIEMAFLAALDRVATFDLAAGRLELRSADRTVLLRFEAEPTMSLSGTAWSAMGVNNGRGGVTSLVDGSAITAMFGANGIVSGSAGCNRFHGPYAITGSRLRIGPLATTRMSCPGPLMEQETAFLAALGRVATFAIEGDRLELRSEDGALQVDLVVLEGA